MRGGTGSVNLSAHIGMIADWQIVQSTARKLGMKLYSITGCCPRSLPNQILHIITIEGIEQTWGEYELDMLLDLIGSVHCFKSALNVQRLETVSERFLKISLAAFSIFLTREYLPEMHSITSERLYKHWSLLPSFYAAIHWYTFNWRSNYFCTNFSKTNFWSVAVCALLRNRYFLTHEQ